MATLACKDINPNTTCDYVTTADTAEEAARKHVAHAREAHAADIADKTDAEVAAAFLPKVRS